jgi:type IV pilus assembly protein PilB
VLSNDELRDAITAGDPLARIRELALKTGMLTLRHDGFRKVREGITTVEEVIHACGHDPEFGELKETTRA